MASLRKAVFQRLADLAPFPEPDLVVLRYPVMMMHGFGLMATLHRGGALHPSAMHLRQHGVWAFAPNVAPYQTVAVRAEMWKERMAHILAQTGAEKVNLIAHSMGGLDARYLVSRLGQHHRVASLITVAAPHHGSPLAEIILEQPALIRTWMAESANWLGTNVIDDAEGNFMEAINELTPEAVTRRFNPQVPDHPDVAYWSYTAAAGRGAEVALNPLFQMFNYLIYKREGPNDGFVSARSAAWGTCHGCLPADHLQQVGLGFPGSSSFKAEDFYMTLVQMLAAQGF